MASRSWNRVELIGNLTRDPELRYTPNGAAVCTFGLATNRTFVTEGEKREEVDFHRLVAWNKLAELCSQLLKKGTKVFVSGRLQTRNWEGADGTQRQTTEIVVEDMIILSPKNNGGVAIAEEIDIDTLPASPHPASPEVRGEPVAEKQVTSAKPSETSLAKGGGKAQGKSLPSEEGKEVPANTSETPKPDENVNPDEDLPF